MNNLPPLPEGFVLEEEKETNGLPPLPEGFILESNANQEDDVVVPEETKNVSQETIEITNPKVKEIEDDISLKKSKIENTRKNIDTFGYDEETKAKVLSSYDMAIQKLDAEKDNRIKELNKQGIVTEDRGSTILERHLASAERFALGASRPILGVMRLGEAITDAVGFTDSETSRIKDFMVENEEYIVNKMKDLNVVGGEGVDVLGQILIEAAPPALALKLLKGVGIIANIGTVSMIETGTIAASEFGTAKEKNGKIVATTPAEALTSGAIAGATVFGGGYLVNRVMAKAGDISIEAKLLADKIGVSNDELTQTLKGVPKDQQALVLAQSKGEDVLGNYQKAVKDSDELRIKLGKDVQKRTEKINAASQKADFKEIKNIANESYDLMKKELDKSNIQIDMSDVTEDINKVKLFSGADETAKNKIIAFENKIEDNPNMSLADVLDMREQINQLLRKTKGNQGYTEYKQLKDNLDGIVENSIPKEYKKLVDDTIGIYRDMKQQKDLLKIINKSSTKEVVSGRSRTAIDYNKALEKIEEEGLDTPVVKQTIKTLKELDDKFNTDFAIMKNTKTKGSNEVEGALGVWSKIVGTIKNSFFKISKIGEEGRDLVIQDAIANAIKKADTPLGYLDEIIKAKDIPNSIKETMINNIEDVRSLSQRDKNKLKATKKFYEVAIKPKGDMVKVR